MCDPLTNKPPALHAAKRRIPARREPYREDYKESCVHGWEETDGLSGFECVFGGEWTVIAEGVGCGDGDVKGMADVYVAVATGEWGVEGASKRQCQNAEQMNSLKRWMMVFCLSSSQKLGQNARAAVERADIWR